MTTLSKPYSLAASCGLLILSVVGCTSNYSSTEPPPADAAYAESENGIIVPLSDIAAAPKRFDGQRLRTSGYLIIEPDNRTLRERAISYDQNEGNCASIAVTDALFNKREAVNRRKVVLSAIVEAGAAEGAGCDRVFLRELKIKSFVTSIGHVDIVPPNAIGGWYDSNDGATDEELLRVLAVKLQSTLLSRATGGDESLLSLVPPRYSFRIGRALKENESRLKWLLFDWSSSLLKIVEESDSLQVDVLQEPFKSASEGKRGALCFCKEPICNPSTISPMRVYYRAYSDPYFCLPVQKEGTDWFLDAGFLVGLPYQEEMRY